ncbi:glycosyltransferase family 2 protein [Flavobacterium hiemivividum]|uniref:Glycosyltransferase family 2 protein n=1 Tax=Flavobacterium hiemivividum TaxID=2541734 RepID=A0A4R5CXR2_9FLAO|nr:glycosyltransferase family A protein [Flavobacterium hiemivividum]TDE04577.1 glycosyltransferase family 2 protein [Flavobacterium hiemivividum]
MNNTVSIIVPCYNQAQYLDEALQSVAAQTYSDWECIVVSDGSPDNTEEVAQRWIAKDSRFKYLYQENSGVSSARNLGISHAKGIFILPLDADDKMAADYVALAHKALHENRSLKVVYCKSEKFGAETGVSILPPFSLFNLSRENMIFCNALFRKEDWASVGGYDVNMVHGLEDWEFWIAILKNGGDVNCIQTTGFYYRIKTESRQTKITNSHFKELFEYLSVKHADFFVSHYGSFQQLKTELAKKEEELDYQLKSEKFVIDLFCKTFLGFTVFNKSFKL